jgi:hypothetical protein
MKEISVSDKSKKFFIVCKETDRDNYVNVKIYDILTNNKYADLNIEFKDIGGDKTEYNTSYEKIENVFNLGGDDLVKEMIEAAHCILL